MHKFKLIFFSLLTSLVLCSCSDSDERNHPLYKKGEKARAAGDGRAAEECFKDLLKRKPDSVAVHLQLGNVYDELLDDPQQAALHYRLYLEAMPDAPDAEEVKAWQKRAEKRCYESMKQRFEPAAPPSPAVQTSPRQPATEAPAAPDADQSERQSDKQKIAELELKIKQFRARHKILTEELERLRKFERNVLAQRQQVESRPADNGQTYVVQENDTPGKISYKVYGKTSLYPVILKANPGVNERNLRPGMVLIIPPAPANQ